MVWVIGYDIARGQNRVVLGPFDSVQVTYNNIIRDDDDNIVLQWGHDTRHFGWYEPGDSTMYTDVVVTSDIESIESNVIW